MTQVFILLALAIAGFFLIDPLQGGVLTKSTPAKAVVLALMFGTLTLHLLGRMYVSPRQWKRSVSEVVTTWWPLLLLSAFVVIGSLYARFVNDVRETFLSLGLAMLFAPLVALAIQSSRQPLVFISRLRTVYVATALCMLAMLMADMHTFHEEIFLAVPLGFYFLADHKASWAKVLLGLALVGATLVSFKNTTFLLVLVSTALFLLLRFLRILYGANRIARMLAMLLGVILAVAALVGVVLVWLQVRDQLPSGNTKYRLETYQLAWDRFLRSPIWGAGFTDSAVIFFRLYRVDVPTNDLPTHSDILDLLSHGGLLAFGLWLSVMKKLASMMIDATARLRSPETLRHEPLWRLVWTLGLVQIGAVVTYAFNPPLLSPNHGLWIWGSLGVMWALHGRLVEARRPLPVMRRQPLAEAT